MTVLDAIAVPLHLEQVTHDQMRDTTLAGTLRGKILLDIADDNATARSLV